jgi:opacity protein-like surface antigen
MRRFSSLFFSILLLTGTATAGAQVVPSATGRQVSITAGGMASIFQPDFAGQWTYVCTSMCSSLSTTSAGYYSPVAQASKQPLFGVGAYVDIRLTRWVQIEAEGRWSRFNAFDGITQDNYLIGPRLPVYHFWKATVYGKALGGFSKMNFDSYGDHSDSTTFAFGGGVDVKLTKRISLRAVDAEYHYWPQWGNSSLSPYGASVGMSYKVF